MEKITQQLVANLPVHQTYEIPNQMSKDGKHTTMLAITLYSRGILMALTSMSSLFTSSMLTITMTWNVWLWELKCNRMYTLDSFWRGRNLSLLWIISLKLLKLLWNWKDFISQNGPFRALASCYFWSEMENKNEINPTSTHTCFCKSWQEITPLTLRLALISFVWSRIK